jgi:CRISPR-associated protein Cas4
MPPYFAMETYLCITQLNDFVFCPRSIYFHNVYSENFGTDIYHKTWQKEGQAAHKAVDEGKYSTRKNILQGMTVYSEKYNILGKIDIFNIDSGLLTERKNSVTAIYDGFRYQVYAQYFALSEMGYSVRRISIYSKKSNKSFPIELPGDNEIREFENLLEKIRTFSLEDKFTQNPRKCVNCIYNNLCDIWKDGDI